MSEGQEHAKRLAEAAPGSYTELKAAAESAVVRWQWATSAVHSLKPAHFEISKRNRGRVLRSEPTEPIDGARAYGFDARGRLVVEREQTYVAGRFYEAFFVHQPEGIATYQYSYDPKKTWINVEWLVVGAPGIVEAHTVYARGNWLSVTYQYDDRGLVVGCQRRGTNPPHADVNDSRELEYDATGQIVRVYWCHPDGRRNLDFERPARDATLRNCRRLLVRQLTSAIVEALRSVGGGDEVFALVLSHCDADYQHRLPPRVSVGLSSERRRLVEEHCARAPEYLWNPAEWSAGDVALELSPPVANLCRTVNQDIWQNELHAEADAFLLELAGAVRNTTLPCRIADPFVSVVVALDRGLFAQQVEQQLDAKTAVALRAARLL